MSSELADTYAPRPVVKSQTVFAGRVWAVYRDRVDLGEAGTVTRDYVMHPGAVGVLALDEQDRVLFIKQYRHPVRYDLWELPAGLLDIDGEAPLACAQRELVEEADLRAQSWDLLMDWFNSPGGMDEAFRLYLARGISPVPEAERHVRTDEEAMIEARWVPLDEAHRAVLGGRLHNPTTVVGILAAHAARADGWSALRPANTPWPLHKRYRPEDLEARS